MNAILIAIGVIAGIGALAALALAVADNYLAVQEDPRIGLATAALLWAQNAADDWKEGDIVFQISKSQQSP